MKKVGRPRIQINWDEFEKLISYQCSQIEIADWFGCSVDALERYCQDIKGESFADIWAKKKNFGRIKIKKRQFEIANSERKDAGTMAIYLGKVYLNQSDKPPEIPPEDPGQRNTSAPQIKTFEEFCTTAGYPLPYPKQVEMAEFGIEGDEPRLVLGARGYGKTDFLTILRSAYKAYVNYMRGDHLNVETCSTILIISKSKSRNTAIIEEITNALEKNGVLIEKQNSNYIRVKGHAGKDHSVEVLTIKSSFRGRHPGLIIMDDPVTEEDTSEAMRVLVKKKYDEAYKLCKNICIIGQPASPFDLYADLRPLVKKMEIPWGSIPELDADLLAMEKAGVDFASISMSFHLIVPTEGSAIFSNLKFIDKYPNGDSVAFIDPSDGGDYTAISIFRRFGDGISVIGFAWKKAWYHCIDDMLPIIKARGVRRLCFETNCTGTQPLEQLRTLLAPQGVGVVGKHSDTNKHACITSAGSYSHLIHLSKESSQVYMDQVVKYEYKSKFDDAPDSLARGLEWIGVIRGKR